MEYDGYNNWHIMGCSWNMMDIMGIEWYTPGNMMDMIMGIVWNIPSGNLT